MKTLSLMTALFTMTLAGAAFADDACVRPPAPAVLDGAKATMEELVAAKNGVTAFIAASDTYQTCLISDLEAKRAAAKDAKTKFDSSLAKAVDALISENQADKVKTGSDFNAAVKAYKAAHPS